MSADGCLICRLVGDAQRTRNPYLVADLGTSLLLMGDDRDGDLFCGYAILAHKEHVREPHQLAPAAATAHFRELLLAGTAVERAFAPDKLNYASFGNEEPHLHWHIIPRYRRDPDFGAQPWRHEDRFVDGMIDARRGAELASRVRACLSTAGPVAA